jgi:hypothetical protein
LKVNLTKTKGTNKVKHTILFKVIARSSNTNSFGLRGHVLISRTGLAVELALNNLNAIDPETNVRVPVRRYDLVDRQSLANAVAHHLHGEIPRALDKAPRKVLKAVFSK